MRALPILLLCTACTDGTKPVGDTDSDASPIADTEVSDTDAAESELAWVALPGGSFTMGADSTTIPGASTADAPAHGVTLSSFEISATEVTNAQYVAFLADAWAAGQLRVESVTEPWPDGSSQTHDWIYGDGDLHADAPWIQLSDAGGVSSSGHVEHADNRSWIRWDDGPALVDASKADWPVTWVKWYGADAYAQFYDLSLPTEAQWEYAARCVVAGEDHTADFATASGTAVASEANWNGSEANADNSDDAVVAVRSYDPNPCGVYEMSGNAWEWVADWYGGAPAYVAADGETDPEQTAGEDPATAMGAASWTEGSVSTVRVRRGGSWNYHTATLATWARAYDFPQRGNNHFGFRVVR